MAWPGLANWLSERVPLALGQFLLHKYWHRDWLKGFQPSSLQMLLVSVCCLLCCCCYCCYCHCCCSSLSHSLNLLLMTRPTNDCWCNALCRSIVSINNMSFLFWHLAYSACHNVYAALAGRSSLTGEPVAICLLKHWEFWLCCESSESQLVRLYHRL